MAPQGGIALKKEIFEQIKKEAKYIGMLLLICLVIFKIVFFKENSIVLLRTVLSLFWLFVLPGYSAMLYWREKFEFIERIVVGIALAIGVTGILSYYLGLGGLNLKYHAALLPLAIIAVGLIAAINKKNGNQTGN
ncbi:hypothetical protein HYV80_02845 [Candidatus Woesearchaeota archaeon]|nr:hypothetical protein [Candidatus Woesearchaeota archaeon]